MTPQLDGPWQRAAAGAGLLGADGRPADTIFAEMSALAASTGAINLGQGFPDTDGPAEVLEAARQAIADGVNQYPPGRGMPVLREAIAAHQARFWGLHPDPATEILVTAGATEALAATLLALVKPGDEVLTVEPFYDAYAAVIGLAGGVHTTVELDLTPEGFVLDPGRLADAITPRTRAIVVNNPHNPTGYQWTREALEALVAAAERADAVLVTDEVYEHLCFDAPHIPLATIPGAAERTVSISSGGKTFSTTGWKIGWLTAPAPLVDAVVAVKQWLTFVNGAPFQPAIAVGLGLPDAVFDRIRDDLMMRRDQLGTALSDAGFVVHRPSAGYFTVADPAGLGLTDAASVCRTLAHEVGVVGIPVSAFCKPRLAREWGGLIRFAQCKREDVLTEACERLERWARKS